MREIKIKISNRVLYSFVAFVVLILLGIVVYAYDPLVVGHVAGEIDFTGPLCNGVCDSPVIALPDGGDGQINIDDPVYISNNLNVEGNIGVSGKIQTDPTTVGDSDDTLVTKSYVDFSTTYSICSWYNGKICPVVSGMQFMMVGYSSTQVQCCGTSGVTCTATNWITYNTYCNAVCPSDWECGTSWGYYVNLQKRTLADCLVEYRSVTTTTSCGISCGSCPSGWECGGGQCYDPGGYGY